MDSSTRAQLIREGNTAFNAGDIRKAREIYLKTEYKDGLVRMGDYFMYDRKLPMLAFGYYKKAGMQSKVDEIFQRMIFALSTWLGKDKFKPAPASSNLMGSDSNVPASGKSTTSPAKIHPKSANNLEPQKQVTPDDFRVHPILRAKALEILNNLEKK